VITIEQLYSRIAALGKKYHANQIVLFGSRARGDNRERSDIDIAVYGMPEEFRSSFWSAVDELPTFLSVDIVHISEKTDPALIRSIERDGIVLMNKAEEKYGKLKHAVQRLNEAIDDYHKNKLDSIRDGVIQRFEFCTELTWKTVREYLLDQGYTEINSPKSVMRQAFADGLIDSDQAWIDLLNDRNATSHIYDEATATQIYQHIEENYYSMFCNLVRKLDKLI
jgi:nucleotidyltransferase substrate binding protein (TIGR01987 family)